MSVNLFKTVRFVIVAMTVSIGGLGWGVCWPTLNAPANIVAMPATGNQDQAGTNMEMCLRSMAAMISPRRSTWWSVDDAGTAQLRGRLPAQEIRVFIYGPLPQPATAKAVTGEISLQRRGNQRVTRLALRHVAPRAASKSYLSAAVDLSRVKREELTAQSSWRMCLRSPIRRRRSHRMWFLSKVRLQVVLAALEQSDRPLIARQKVCPDNGAALDSMGGPVKVLVGDSRLYLCCKGCLAQVQSDPEGYLRKASPAKEGQ